MTYSDIKQQIADGTLENFYIFAGEEIEVQRVYINKIAESKKQIIKRIDSVTEAIKFKGLSLLNQSFCYVCRGDVDFQKATDEVWDTLQDKVGENTLIYLPAKLDKRSRFYMHWESRILIFDPLTPQVLTKHIRQYINLSSENCNELIRVCDSDYGRILSEIDKIQQFRKSVGAATDISASCDTYFIQLLNDGTIYQPPTDAIFEWVNAVLAGKPKKAFALWEECIEIGEPSLRLLLVLYQGVKRLLQVQSCEVKDICGNTGLSQWEVNLVKDYIGVYHTGELVAALRNIRELEMGIKTGRIDEEFAVPYAMISLISE